MNWKWKLWPWFRTFLWFLVNQALGCKHADLTVTFIQLMLGRPLPFFWAQKFLCALKHSCTVADEPVMSSCISSDRASSSLTHLILKNKKTEGIVQPINEKSVIMSCLLWEFLSSLEQKKPYLWQNVCLPFNESEWWPRLGCQARFPINRYCNIYNYNYILCNHLYWHFYVYLSIRSGF